MLAGGIYWLSLHLVPSDACYWFFTLYIASWLEWFKSSNSWLHIKFWFALHYYTISLISHPQEKFQDMFSNAYRKMKMTLYATITPSASNKLWDPSFMVDCLNNINIR